MGNRDVPSLASIVANNGLFEDASLDFDAFQVWLSKNFCSGRLSPHIAQGDSSLAAAQSAVSKNRRFHSYREFR